MLCRGVLQTPTQKQTFRTTSKKINLFIRNLFLFNYKKVYKPDIQSLLEYVI